MAGAYGYTKTADDLTSNFRFRLVKKDRLEPNDGEKQRKVDYPITLQPKNVSKEDVVKIRRFESERRFACIKKSGGRYDCVEIDTKDFSPQ